MAKRGAKRPPKMDLDVYETEVRRLQAELVAFQEWVRATGQRVVVVFEGRDAAGKGSAIKRITEYLSPRVARIAALPAPTDREKSQWYFQRYIAHLPAAGEIVLFDRSWYNRAGVERVMGFCTDEQYARFLEQAPLFEQMLVDDGVILRKYWFSVSDVEQERRFRSRAKDPMRQWKLSPMDLESITRWEDYSEAKDIMMAATSTELGAVARRRVRGQAPLAGQRHAPPAQLDPARRRGARRAARPQAPGPARLRAPAAARAELRAGPRRERAGHLEG